MKGLKGEVERRFEHGGHIPVMDVSFFMKLSLEETLKLEDLFHLKEIRSVVWDIANSKSPESDGLNFKFIQKFWSLLKVDLVKIMNEFHMNSKFNMGM